MRMDEHDTLQDHKAALEKHDAELKKQREALATEKRNQQIEAESMSSLNLCLKFKSQN